MGIEAPVQRMKKQMTANKEISNPGLLSLVSPQLGLCLVGAIALAGCDSEQAEAPAQPSAQAPSESQVQPDEAEFRRARVEARQSRRSGFRLPRWFFSQITPHVTCVEELENGQLRARWGYTNHTKNAMLIPRGAWNGIAPAPAVYPLTPRLFRSGRHEDVFRTVFDPSEPATWWLMWNTAEASKDSPACEDQDLCADVVCNDDDPCTMDECQPADGSCTFVPKEDGMDCEFEGEAGVCEQGQCQVNECQTDADCNDNNLCNGVEICSENGACVPSPGLNCDDQNPCTEDACDPEAGCTNTPANENQQCEGPDGSGICQAGACETLSLYTAGHGELGIALSFDAASGEFEPHLHLDGATVNGVTIEDQEFHFHEIALVTDAQITRPSESTAEQFAGLCVDPGESLHWLPQSGTEAHDLGVPFFGIAAEEIGGGVLVEDRIELSLVDVQSPNGNGAYSVWNFSSDGAPNFIMSSCGGIDEDDTLLLSAGGHAHYNMGFAKGGEGLWKVTYQVRGVSTEGNQELSSTFTVNYLVQ